MAIGLGRRAVVTGDRADPGRQGVDEVFIIDVGVMRAQRAGERRPAVLFECQIPDRVVPSAIAYVGPPMTQGSPQRRHEALEALGELSEVVPGQQERQPVGTYVTVDAR